jgi:hypothetical protein
MEEIVIPALVLELAKKAATEKVPAPKAIAWRETEEAVIIVFEDGRKLIFERDQTPPALFAGASAPSTERPIHPPSAEKSKSKK